MRLDQPRERLKISAKLAGFRLKIWLKTIATLFGFLIVIYGSSPIFVPFIEQLVEMPQFLAIHADGVFSLTNVVYIAVGAIVVWLTT